VRVVVTGGAGFIGSHVADAFVVRGDEVLVVDDFSSGSRDYLPEQAKLEELDIADADRVQEPSRTSRPSTSATWRPRRA
jgi:UDP-glucose 4-epimerase